MRQPQQKNRMRGRGRKPSNPLSRNFESNGPDVKIRGNASHIADKYASLARDAASSGDTVMAENYLQHAEHYNRIVATANNNANNNQNNSANRSDEQVNGRGPQPDVNERDGGDKSENTQRDARDDRGQPNGSQAAQQDNSSRDNADAAASEKPRRESRSRRRPRSTDDSDAAENANGAADTSSDQEASTSDEPATKDMTSDAAKLPGSLLGVASDDSEPGALKDD